MKAVYHLPGLFEFYDLKKAFCRFSAATGTGSMTGVRSARSTALLPAAGGTEEEPDSETRNLLPQQR